MTTMRGLFILFLTMISVSVNGQTLSLTASDTTTISFRVEFAAVSLPLNLSDIKYKDLPHVDYYKDRESNLFRYNSGDFTSLSDAKKHADLLISFGLSESHVVAIKNGRKIRLEDIPKYNVSR